MNQYIEPLKIIEGEELNQFQIQLEKQFGIKKIPGRIVMRGRERVFLFSGDIEEKDLRLLEKNTFVERAGTYIAKNVDGEYRLSIEGSQIFKDQITKNIVELNEEEMLEWMYGSEVLKKTGLKGFVIMKYKEDMLGTGKASEEKITNFIPKSRRLKRKE
jgi:NOL1/NOP2/fmu family ribosome biogenesis protein